MAELLSDEAEAGDDEPTEDAEEPEEEPAPTPAGRVNVDLYADKTAAMVGEIVTVEISLTASRGVAYGFTLLDKYHAGIYEFQSDVFAADNEAAFPGIEVPEPQIKGTKLSETESGHLRITYTSNDVVFEDGVTKTLTLKFKLVAAYTGGYVSELYYGTIIESPALIIVKDFDVTTLQDENGNFDSVKMTIANRADAQQEPGKFKAILLPAVIIPYYKYVTVSTDLKQGIRIKAEGDEEFGTTVSVDVGDFIDIEYYLEPGEGMNVYGYVGGFTYDPRCSEIDIAATEAANPELVAAGMTFEGPFTQSSTMDYVLIKYDGHGIPIATHDEPFRIFGKLKVVCSSDSTFTVAIGGSTSAANPVLITDPDFQLSALFNEDGSVVLARDRTFEAARKVVTGSTATTGRVTVLPPFEATFKRNAEDLAAKPTLRVGDTVLAELTFNTAKDIYGCFVAAGSVGGTRDLIIDTETLKADNPQLADAIDSGSLQFVPGVPYATGTSYWLVYESDGETVILEAGESLTVRVRYHIMAATMYKQSLSSATTMAVLINKDARFLSDDGLYQIGKTVAECQTEMKAAERAGLVLISSVSNPDSFTISYSASITFGDATGYAGTSNPEPFDLKTVISNDSDSAAYGFEVGITWRYILRAPYTSEESSSAPGMHVSLDTEATIAANPHMKLVMGGYREEAYSYAASRQMWVESDGKTELIPAGETLDLTLVFVAVGGWRETIVSHDLLDGTVNSLILLTDPNYRILQAGEGLTRINFQSTLFDSAERNGHIIKGRAIGAVTANGAATGTESAPLKCGVITLKPAHDELKLLTNSAYLIKTAEDLDAFARIVNAGDNAIYGAILSPASEITASDGFTGIGTEEFPFRGDLYGSNATGSYQTATITVNRTAAAQSGASIGGLVNVLGEGGIVRSLIVLGSVGVTGSNSGETMNVGGVVGKSVGGTIDEITNEAAVTAADGANANVGGIVGYMTKSEIPNIVTGPNKSSAATRVAMSNVKNLGAVSGGTNSGGIAGVFAGNPGDETIRSRISYAGNSGDISNTAADSSVGGIVGLITGGIIQNSGNGVDLGYINTYTYPDRADEQYRFGNAGRINGAGSAGGVAGKADAGAVIKSVYNIGVIAGATAGGIVGTVDGSAAVKESWVSGDPVVAYLSSPSVTGTKAAGGIVGVVVSEDASIMHNFSLGAISGAVVGGVTGSAAAKPTYAGNFYLAGTAATDALSARGVAPETLLIDKPSSQSYASYSYVPTDAPELGEDGFYLIYTAEDLIWFSNTVNNNRETPKDFIYTGGVYDNEINGRLMADINLVGEKFTYIGANVNRVVVPNPDIITYPALLNQAHYPDRYEGTFDGNGFSITNITDAGSGVFGSIGPFAVIKNLTFYGAVTGRYASAGIIASTAPMYIQLSADHTDIEMISASQIYNCVNYADVTGATAGGITLTISFMEIRNCENYGKITGTEQNAGGIVASSSLSRIIDCTNYGDVTAFRIAGGITGSLAGSSVYAGDSALINCKNEGNITTTEPDVVATLQAAGGIAGTASGFFVILDCENSGTIRSPIYAGGIVGNVTAGTSEKPNVISGCSNYGDVVLTYTGNRYIYRMSGAGIVGNVDVYIDQNNPAVLDSIIISDNYNKGSVTSDSGYGGISSIGNLNTGDMPDSIASGNTTAVLNGGETAERLGGGYAPEPEPDPGTDPNNNQTPSNPGTGDGTGLGTGGGDSYTGTAAPSGPAAPAVISEAGTPASGFTPDEIPAAAPTVQIDDPAPPLGNVVPETLPNRTSSNPRTNTPSESVPDVNVPNLIVAAEENITSTTVEEDEPEAVVPPANVSQPELNDEIVPEIVRETVKNNSVIIVIIIAAVVVVVAGGGALFIRRRKA